MKEFNVFQIIGLVIICLLFLAAVIYLMIMSFDPEFPDDESNTKEVE